MKQLVCFGFLLFTYKVNANITLPSILGNNMILQQQSSVKFWGWGDPTEKVLLTPSWNGKTDSIKTGSDGKWALNLTTPAAGGPYSTFNRGVQGVID